MIFARAKGIGVASNTYAEIEAIKEALEYIQRKELKDVTVEMDSLTLKRMIDRL